MDSEVVDASRQRIRSELPRHLAQLQRTLYLAVEAIDGPDPEAAVGFLRLLDEHLEATLAAFP